jgi:anti-sigma factor RsiW
MTHLSPESVAAYLDDDLPSETKRQAELHLASCGECREELAAVRRLQRSHRRRWFPVLGALAAAAVVLVMAVPGNAPSPSNTRALRNTESPLETISPASSAAIDPGRVEFIWRSAGPRADYTVTLQDTTGRVVWTSTGADTVAVLPDTVALGAAQTWFWVVDALAPEGQSRSTGLKRLRTRP